MLAPDRFIGDEASDKLCLWWLRAQLDVQKARVTVLFLYICTCTAHHLLHSEDGPFATDTDFGRATGQKCSSVTNIINVSHRKSGSRGGNTLILVMLTHWALG